MFILYPLHPDSKNITNSPLNHWLEMLEAWLVSHGLPFMPMKQLADSGVFHRNRYKHGLEDLHFQCKESRYIWYSGSCFIH